MLSRWRTESKPNASMLTLVGLQCTTLILIEPNEHQVAASAINNDAPHRSPTLAEILGSIVRIDDDRLEGRRSKTL
jgi:hypothetical protein